MKRQRFEARVEPTSLIFWPGSHCVLEQQQQQLLSTNFQYFLIWREAEGKPLPKVVVWLES